MRLRRVACFLADSIQQIVRTRNDGGDARVGSVASPARCSFFTNCADDFEATRR